jgi:nicotinamidase-related amidase
MLERKKTVLVVVDMQNGFLNEKSRHVIPNVVRVVQEFETRQIPVIFTRFHNEPGSPYERLIGWERLRTSPETDLTEEMRPHAKTVIDKNFYSVFTSEFKQRVKKAGWSNIVLCGVATDGCVLKTAIDSFERGLTPFVVKDACASHAGEEVHQAGLLLLSRFIGKGQILETASIIRLLDDMGR